MKKDRLSIVILSALLSTGCSTILSNMPGVYSLDIYQGNMIDQSMVDQLRPNMSKRQVLYIMGSPMLADTFHERRWDYLFSEQKGGEERVQKRISLFFNGDNLIGIQGDVRPSSLPVVKPTTETTVELPKRHLERSMGEKITGLFESDATAPEAEKTLNDPEPPKPESSDDKGLFDF